MPQRMGSIFLFREFTETHGRAGCVEMTTDSLLLDIWYWMDFVADEDYLADGLRDCNPIEWERYKQFGEMYMRSINKVMQGKDK
jgi:hypothetical protein